jgi:HEAT repeat protein
MALVCAAAAQAPVVGDINFYGLHKIAPERILGAAKLKSGSALPPSKGDIEDAIAEIPGVLLARVEAVCCDGAETILFIGVEEKGTPHAAFRSPPSGDARLPGDLLDAYRQFLTAVQRAARSGNAVEDLSAGHSMMADAAARAYQEQFVNYAREHVDLLRSVLRTAADAEQRAAAAVVIGYAGTKPTVVNDLQYAMQDPDDAVRANAIRSLNGFAVLASKQPALGIKISPTWFIELLHSIVLSDRVESAKALLTITDRGEPAVLQQIRERAAGALAEMARWKTPRFALPSFFLIGRVAGLPDQQIQESWRKGDREPVITKVLAVPVKRR